MRNMWVVVISLAGMMALGQPLGALTPTPIRATVAEDGGLKASGHAKIAVDFHEGGRNRQGEVLVQIPSDVGGATGIGVRVVVPDKERYPDEGAPVAIHVEGGTNAGGLTMDGVGLVDYGFVEIFFNFPGSGHVNPSGGVYDYRGPNCVAALRDVTRFALGELSTTEGDSLPDITNGVMPLSDNVGFVAFSNGGNAALVSAGLHGANMQGLAWIVNYESPVGDGMPTADAGHKAYASFNNPPHNPAYDPDIGVWDLSTLKYDAALDIAFYLNLSGESFPGGFYFDHNGNDRVDAIQDFVPTPFYIPAPGGITAYYSERIVDYAVAHSIYPLPVEKPAHLPAPGEVADFWLYRNGEKYFADILTHNPNLLFLVTAHEIDHVQTALDHPHVLIQYEGMRLAGAPFVRLNPDSDFVNGVTLDYFPTLVDNDALHPFDHISIRSALQPTGSVNLSRNVVGGCCELADRTQTGNLAPQIEYRSWQPARVKNWPGYK